MMRIILRILLLPLAVIIMSLSIPSCRSLLLRNNIAVVHRIPEHIWRDAAMRHKKRIRQLLLPGLLVVSQEKATTTSNKRKRLDDGGTTDDHLLRTTTTTTSTRKRLGDDGDDNNDNDDNDCWTALDSKNPVYNFLIEYYGLKGTKGPRRLGRWSPDPALLIQECLGDDDDDDDDQTNRNIMMKKKKKKKGVLLENANEQDIGDTLHLRGAVIMEGGEGILYSPSLFIENKGGNGNGSKKSKSNKSKAATPYLWYRSILQRTLDAEPVLHCHGFHEWAMQFHPPGAPPPPSAKYQSHLRLRVDRQTICETVERRGISCTHVDALRFFAPAAGPLNSCGSTLERIDQLRLEQPACVHAHMDLLKMSLRLQPFISAELIQNVLELALKSRRLDVAASPYDASAYGVGVVPVETCEGRAQYRKEQIALMRESEPVRKQLLRAYDMFLSAAFSKDELDIAQQSPSAERFAIASPGSPPWRKNLIVDANTDDAASATTTVATR